jgi:hypothetical protein
VCAPPLAFRFCVHSPATSPPPFGPCAASTRTRSALVVSHHFDGFLRRIGLGFVAPRSQTGFAAFRGARPPSRQPRLMPGGIRPGPRNAVHTPRRIPLASSRSTSPWPLPSCHCRRCPAGQTPKRQVVRTPYRQIASGMPRTTKVVPATPKPRRVPRISPKPRPEQSTRSVPPRGNALTVATPPPSRAGLGPPSDPSEEGPCATCPDAEAPRREVHFTTRTPLLNLPRWTACSRIDQGRSELPCTARKRAPREPSTACPHECGPDQGTPPRPSPPSRSVPVEAARHPPTNAGS